MIDGVGKMKVIIVVAFLFSTQSIGYDLYAHSLIYYFNTEDITFSYHLEFANLLFPRYFLLSYIYESSRVLGIPTGWIALFLVSIPSICFVGYYNSNVRTAIAYKLEIYAAFLLLLILFYSALTLSLMWLMVYVITRKPIFLMGSFFHPVGILASLFVLFFVIRLSKSFFVYLSFVGMLFFIALFDGYLNVFKTVSVFSVKYTIELNEIFNLMIFAMTQKKSELLLFLLVAVVVYIGSKSKMALKILNLLMKIFSFKYFFLFVILFFSINAIERERESLLKAVVFGEFGEVVLLTWFHVGYRDHSYTYDILNHSRFD